MGSGAEKPIRLSGHARPQLASRGGIGQEVVEAIRTTPWGPAELGRLECRKNHPLEAAWNGVRYRTKQVRPIFVEDPDEIVVVTVCVYYL
jgi:hypothetical protein